MRSDISFACLGKISWNCISIKVLLSLIRDTALILTFRLSRKLCIWRNWPFVRKSITHYAKRHMVSNKLQERNSPWHRRFLRHLALHNGTETLYLDPSVLEPACGGLLPHWNRQAYRLSATWWARWTAHRCVIKSRLHSIASNLDNVTCSSTCNARHIIVCFKKCDTYLHCSPRKRGL